MKDKGSPQSLASWIKFLKNDILVDSVNDDTVGALCGHLADLGILQKTGEDNWSFVGLPGSLLKAEQGVEQRLIDIGATEKGFALRYFLKNFSLSQVTDVESPESSETENNSTNNPELLGQKTSNLSNLQIVKKYGRQVQSFVQLEKKYTEKLLGPHTTLREARKIFNFILGRMKQKTEPRSWEQLSRRRHK